MTNGRLECLRGRGVALWVAASMLVWLAGAGCAGSSASQRTNPGPTTTPEAAEAPPEAAAAETEDAGSQAVPSPPGPSPTGGDLFLWSVDGSTGARSWLYGSFHLRRAGDTTLPAAALAAFEESEVLVLELPDLDEAAAEAALLMAKYGVIDDGRKIQDILGPELTRETEQALAGVGLSLAPMAHFRPSVVGVMLTVNRAVAAGFVESTGVDRLFFARTKDPASPGPSTTAGLETTDEQMSALFALPEDQQIASLREIVRVTEAEARQLLLEMLTAYQTGDAAEIVRLTEEGAGSDPAMADYLERILYARNDLMVERLVPMLKEPRPLFVVVGAGHLVGERNIPDQLRELGYRVTRHRDVLPLRPPAKELAK